jgi:hypothetical protein
MISLGLHAINGQKVSSKQPRAECPDTLEETSEKHVSLTIVAKIRRFVAWSSNTSGNLRLLEGVFLALPSKFA